MPNEKATVRYHFSIFEVNAASGEVLRQGVRVKLQEQPFRLLVRLLERAGEVVTREELRSQLWPTDTFVEFDNSLNVAVRKLREALRDEADNPRFLETVPRRGYRFIAPVSVAAPANPVQRSNSTPANLVAAVFTVLVVAFAGYWLRPIRLRSANASVAATVIPARRSVAVLGFRNLPGRPDDDWLSAALSEMLNTELAAGGNLRLVSGEDVAHAKRELQISNADTLSKATLASLHANSGADMVVLGSYMVVEDHGEKKIRVDIRLQDTVAGETRVEAAFTGEQGNLFEVASQAAARVRQGIGSPVVSSQAMNEARAFLPANEQAERFYAEGRARLWNFDFLAARDFLVKAVAADPNNAGAHAALADAWAALGYNGTAQKQAKQAMDLSSTLAREDQLWIEGRYRVYAHDWPEAIKIYRALTEFFPDNLEYGLKLADALSRGDRAQDSFAAVESLRRLPKPISDDPRIDLQEGYTSRRAGDYQRLERASASAASKAEKHGSLLLLADSRLMQSLAAIRLKNPQGAFSFDEQAQQIYQQAGDQYGVAKAEYRMGDLLFQQGQFAQSNAVLERCLEIYRTVGADADAAETLGDMGGGFMEMGQLNKAKVEYEEELVQQRLVESQRGIAEALLNLGAVMDNQGDITGARRYDEEALTAYKGIGEKYGIAMLQSNLGLLYLVQGDLSAGKNLIDESLVLRREMGNESDIARSLHNLGDALADAGDVDGARKSYDEAIAIQAKRGEQANAAETRLSKAELMLELGDATNAEPLIRSAIDQFRKEKQLSEEISAHDSLAETLLELGKVPEAKAEIAQATSLADKNQKLSYRLKTQIAAARVLCAQGRPDDAIRNLRLSIREAEKAGFFVHQLEASLALGKIEAKARKAKESEALLRSVEKEARSKGYLLIARQAAEARS